MPNRLQEVSASPMLREYAQGAAQTSITKVADFLAPPVDVSTMVGRYKKYTSSNRFRLPDTVRDLRGRATIVGWDAKDEMYNCTPHALDVPVDILESDETESIENAMQEAADEAAAIAALSHEKSVIDAALAGRDPVPAEFGPGANVIDYLDSVILEVIKAARYGSAMGVGLLFGASAFKGVKNHPKVVGRIVSSGPGGARPLAVVNEEVVGTLLIGNPQTRVTFAVVDATPEGLAPPDEVRFLLDNSILVFARMANPTRRDPSFMKTFRLRNKWMVPGSYMRDDQRVEVAKFDWSEGVYVANFNAAVLLTPNFDAPSSSSSPEGSSESSESSSSSSE